jgi:arginine N-succinyltransferase
VLQGRVSELRDSALVTAAEGLPSAEPEHTLISNTVLKDFRMIVAQSTPATGAIALSAAQLELLHCTHGDQLRTLPLNVRKNVNV